MSAADGCNLGTAIITGASSGIGKVYADRLAKRGYDLTLVARRVSRLEALAIDLKANYGTRVTTMVADLSNSVELDKLAQAVAEDTSVTLLVNNAGTNTTGALSELKPKDLEAMINVNVIALSRLTLAVLPGFKKRDRGAIVNIGSVLGFQGYPSTSIYSGAKAFVLVFTRALQAELSGTSIVVQLVAPAGTISEIWDVQGFPLSNVPAEVIMTTENCVDASLKGLDLREKTTLPSVDNLQLLADYDAASAALFAASQTGKPAARYTVSR